MPWLTHTDEAGVRLHISRVFSFDQTRQAYEYLKSQLHIGKVVIDVTEASRQMRVRNDMVLLWLSYM